MRNLILGGVLAVWGAAVLILTLSGGGAQSGHGAYHTGHSIGLVFAGALVVVGTVAVRKGPREKAGR